MRPFPARVLLSTLLIGSFATAVLSSQLVFYVVALMAGFLLATSLSTARVPVTRALLRFRNCPVEVRLWGALPPITPGAHLILTSVNLLGSGFHVFFQINDRTSIHLKVAQPSNIQIASNVIVVGRARYVQWQADKVTANGGSPAVSIALSTLGRPADN